MLQYFFGFRPFHYVKIWTTKTSRVQIRGETSGGLTTYYTIDLRRIPKPLENPTTYLLMSSVQNRNVFIYEYIVLVVNSITEVDV